MLERCALGRPPKESPVSTTDTLLADHQSRKNADGVTWFMAEDLRRLGIDLPVMGAMQTAQHTLRMRRAFTVVETAGSVDRFSLRDVH